MKRITTRGEKNKPPTEQARPRKAKDGPRPAVERALQREILFERHPLPMWVFDEKTLRILAVNEAAVGHYGYTRKEFLSMTIQDIRPPEQVPALLKYLHEQEQSKPPRGLGRTKPWVHRKKDGTLIDVEISWSRISLQGRSAILAMAHDVTERRKNQEQIEQHLDRLRILHEISAAVTTSLDLNTVLEFFLRKANRLLPYSVFTIRLWNEKQQALEPVICRNLNEREWKAQSGISRGLTAVPFETNEPFAVTRIDTDPRASRPEFARKQGLVSYLGVPLSVKGEVIGVLSTYTREEHQFSGEEIEFFSTLASQVAFAIHNAKIYEQAQQTLKRLHALYEVNAAITPLLKVGAVLDTLLKKAAELLPYVTVTIRVFNKDTGKLDAAACWNIDEEEWKSEEANPPHGFASAVFETKAPIIIRNVQTDPIVRNHDLFRRHGLVSCVGVPLISQEEILGTITFYTREEREFSAEEVEFLSTLAGLAGIAVQKSRLYEEIKKTAQELQKANRVKDEFLSVVSHELRTPLNVVMGYAGIIRDRLFGEINSRQEETLGKILARTNDQLTLVNNILYATALESSDLGGKSYALSMGDFFEQLKEAYQFPVGKEVTLNWNLPPRGLVVNTDPDKLKHVLQNLIDNAIKFTEKGSVTVSARAVQGNRQQTIGNREKAEDSSSSSSQGTGVPPDASGLVPGAPRHIVEIKVQDTGIGLTREQTSLIFQKFYQLDGSQTRLYGGVGLGLYIVKRFTEMLGGKIEVESAVGKGSTFTVTIPC